MADKLNFNEIPMGLSMAFAKNINAFNNFSGMTTQEQNEIIEHTHQINSKKEMQAFVKNIADGNPFMQI